MTEDSDAFLSPAQLLRQHGLRAKKKWGQCFLHERQVAMRIVETACPPDAHHVVEIGPGLGALTALLLQRAQRLTAIERDPELALALRRTLPDRRLQLVCADALHISLAAIRPPAFVVGNLPYNISTPLLFRLLDDRAGWQRATLMLQREVAERICAGPGTKQYGAPTVLLDQHCHVELALHVGRGAFVPAPDVESAVVTLRRRATPVTQVDDSQLRRVVRAAFGQRRKTLRKALTAIAPKDVVLAALLQADVAETARAEVLSTAEFGRLAKAFSNVSSTG